MRRGSAFWSGVELPDGTRLPSAPRHSVVRPDVYSDYDRATAERTLRLVQKNHAALLALAEGQGKLMSQIDDLNAEVAAIKADVATLTTAVNAAVVAFQADAQKLADAEAVLAAAGADTADLAAARASLEANTAALSAATPAAPAPAPEPDPTPAP